MSVLSPADEEWSRKQARLTNISTALTATGAAGLGTMLAGKTKIAGKVLPKKLHRKLQSGAADDVRNSVALASMVSGVVSGHKWARKLNEDAGVARAVHEGRISEGQVKNLAEADKRELAKGLVSASVVRGPGGIRTMRGATYRRVRLPRPRRRF